MLDVIRKKPKIQTAVAQPSVVPRESGIAAAGPVAGGMNSGMNTGMGGIGYNMARRNDDAGAQGGNGGTMMGMQQAPAAYQYQNAQPLQNAQAQGRATYTKQQFNDKRGSDFKKTAQQMFSKKQ